MKIAVLVSLLASAAAFAPAKTASQSTALNSFEKELGAQQPLGFWVRVRMRCEYPCDLESLSKLLHLPGSSWMG
jgi:hypothetical protein